MTCRLTFLSCAAIALAISVPLHGQELARIATHSQRYGGQIEISAFDDPLLKGVTCYVSRSHNEHSLGGTYPTPRTPDAQISCHQVGKLTTPAQVPQQAQVFDESVDPVFKVLHVIRVLDPSRLAVVYFSYNENELAGDLPGHVDVIQLPVRGRRPPE
ncbi:CreA family protein [Paraburkholderia diazotrophica]|uniref:CreA protein n=1 Tax=Paraburkholderia diazotrophica TaxID=667676 RepID=A0A1H7C1Q4_9BURK|nr:CreA family protein [Paraburkholderia diazotrophica]SEJ83783.1 CreA protein [Paraburkholderia diazotrophica]